jgi:hypothetical protein
MDLGEDLEGGTQEQGEGQTGEVCGEFGDPGEECVVFCERGSAAVGEMGGAEPLTAFWDAAATVAGGKKLSAFRDHDEFPPSKRKGSPRRAL